MPWMKTEPVLGLVVTICAAAAVLGCPAHNGPRLSREPVAPAAKPARPAAQYLSALTVRVRLTAGHDAITLRARSPIGCVSGGRTVSLDSGMYTFAGSEVAPARQRFHLLTKTFMPNELDEASAHLAEMRDAGHAPALLEFGDRFETSTGALIDTRTYRVSIARFDTLKAAESAKERFETQELWASILPERTEPGAGSLVVSNDSNAIIAEFELPITLRAETAIVVHDIDFGFWGKRLAHRAYGGGLAIEAGPDAALELYETVAFETYLAGVLPAEMPALWPSEALKAQAVAARSEVLASANAKHKLEGFDFCGSEHCRAYLGEGGRHSATDAAVAATAGEVLVLGERVVPAVFSATCGGWTEDNENVWAAPPHAALRAVPDFPPIDSVHDASPARSDAALERWLRASPPAFCRGDGKYFRWKRRFSAAELTDIVNQRYPLGAIRRIELGARGRSGRLKWVRLVGAEGEQIVRKELAIRFAFGGLPSAMFLVDVETGAQGPAGFTFVGGGRGHGVGLCQYGARGMAAEGFNYKEILGHYYAKANMLRLD